MRIRTIGQTFEMPLYILEEIGFERIFKEKISRSKINRPRLKRTLSSLRAGDAVIVARTDCMARSTFDLFAIVGQSSQKDVAFRFIAELMMPITKTT